MDITSALASTIEEAVLRTTDGMLRLTDEQLRKIAQEVIFGESAPRGYEVMFTGKAFAFRPTAPVVHPANRRPAPTVDEAWEASKLADRARDAELAADEDPSLRKFAAVPQPLYSPDISFEELPELIVRQCCPRKSCDTVLQKKMIRGDLTCEYLYVRASNGDVYSGLSAATVAELVAALNDPYYWPNHWMSDVPQEGLDFNAPPAQ